MILSVFSRGFIAVCLRARVVVTESGYLERIENIDLAQSTRVTLADTSVRGE